MGKIIRCNRIGFHYNDFLYVSDKPNHVCESESPIKFFKKIYFCSNSGSWANIE
jgi:hypothetical protein